MKRIVFVFSLYIAATYASAADPQPLGYVQESQQTTIELQLAQNSIPSIADELQKYQQKQLELRQSQQILQLMQQATPEERIQLMQQSQQLQQQRQQRQQLEELQRIREEQERTNDLLRKLRMRQ